MSPIRTLWVNSCRHLVSSGSAGARRRARSLPARLSGARRPERHGVAGALALAVFGGAGWMLAPAAVAAGRANPAATGGGSITCTSDLPEFGKLDVTQAMPAGSSGSLLLGMRGKNHFIGTCLLSGTIPAGWTVTEISFAALSATSGSGNAGTFVWDTNDSAFMDPGTFLNSGTFIDRSSGFSQTIEVGRFVDSGTVESDGPGLSTGAVPGASSSELVDLGRVVSGPRAVFSSGDHFVLGASGTIAGPGDFSIANLSVFDVEGGSVAGGTVTTGQFLGRGPATIEFGRAPGSSSRGSIAVSTGVNLAGTVPPRWSLQITGGTVEASGASNLGRIAWHDAPNSQLVDPGTFVNAGTISDSGTGFVQQLAVAHLVNTGTIVADAPGFGMAGPSSTVAPLLENSGTIVVEPKSGFAAAGTVVLRPGGHIVAHGAFDVAGTIVEIDGGAVSGALTDPYHLGATPATIAFGTGSASSSGTFDNTIAATIRGVVPRHWTVVLGSGAVTAVASGNLGTLEWAGGATLTSTSAFTNDGFILGTTSAVSLGAPEIVNHGRIVASATSGLSVSGSLLNAGAIAVHAAKPLTVSAGFDQQAGGSLGLLTAGPEASASLAVAGAAHLGGSLSLSRPASYVPKAGDVLTVLTAKSVLGRFVHVTTSIAPPGLRVSVRYTPTTVDLALAR